MSDALHGIEEDVRFNHDTCDTLQAWCTSTASTITGDAASRASAVARGSTDFRGHFSELFASNADVARADATELAERLRELSRLAGYLQESARAEQARREKARAWMQEREDRSWIGEKWDDLTESEEDATPPVGPPDPPAPQTANLSLRGGRQTPQSGGGGGGTSSARPDKLRSFATTSSSMNTALAGKPGELAGRLSDFAAQCEWGTLDGSSVVSGFRQWNAANEEDARWANVVAAAFERAGGDGPVSTLSNSALAAALRAAGVDATRDDITIDPAIAVGAAPTTGYAVDPVNTATGNFLETEVDLGFNHSAQGLTWARTYNSFDPGTGAFGPGWSSWTEAGLAFTDESARMRLEDGRVVVFPRQGDGWGRATGENLWLERIPEGYLASDNTGTTWVYTAGGRLHTRSTGPGAEATYHRDGDGRLVRVTHARGRSLELSWRDARVVAIAASDGRQATYAYDDHGRLVAATGDQGTRTYDWNPEGVIHRVTDADGVVELDNEYDDQRRVTRQRSQHGRLVKFSYLGHHITVVSDEDGGRSNTWLHDRRGRLIGVVDSDEHRQSMSYDQWGNLVVVSERNGDVTVHEHDDRGRRIRTVTPSGADLTFGYDDLDRVTTVVAASGGVVDYTYEGNDRNPSVMTDPEGGRTRFNWTDGLLTRIEDPSGVVVAMGYDDHGDLVATTDADGNTARLERDAVGRVTAAITPGGHRTTYTYDGLGRLVSRSDPDGSVWRYENTTGGRLAAVTDPTGARTTIEYAVSGEESRTTDPIGRTVTRHTDDVGHVRAVELPDGSQWQFTRDALSRLTEVTDPAGATWRREYDANGQLTATVDPTGVRTGIAVAAPDQVTIDDGLTGFTTRFDPWGRPVRTDFADGSAALTTYDLCGRAVELVDAEGGLTLLRRNAAGRVVETTSPGGATTRYDYDRCGRLSVTTDPHGGRTVREYDADSRLVREVLPTGEAARADYDACGRVVALHQPGRGTARYAYDGAGRIVESSDTWYGHRRFRYDAAGQLVAATNGNGGVTRFDYDDLGRQVRVTDPTGHTTTREFDAAGRRVAETDPLGRTTRFGYDEAGRQVSQTTPSGQVAGYGYDPAGRPVRVTIDGTTVLSVGHDLRARTSTFLDRTRSDGREVVHELAWNGRGQLVRRSRDGRAVTWDYDADGRRTSLTSPSGVRTSYRYDDVGNLVGIDHPLLGRAVLEHDASGRLVRASAGRTTQTWEHSEGSLSDHTTSDGVETRRTRITRDEQGRIASLTRDGATVRYTHDGAGQLVEARGDTAVNRWTYDAAGRLVSESVDGKRLEHHYDAASQLLVTRGSGTETRHDYDAMGRRTRTEVDGRTVRETTWSPLGWLAGIADGEGQRVALHVDALGELCEVDGVELWWDTLAPVPSPLRVAGTDVLSLPGITGAGHDWIDGSWRSARNTVTDPWTVGSARALSDALALGGAGELLVAGLEWMGARVYDPATRGFLSFDPLRAVEGAGWSGNPYSFAGNDPLHQLDPSGLRAATDADLQAYAAAHAGPLAGAWEWTQNNWEYLAGGVMVAGGLALMFVPGGQVVGMGLMSAGADTIIQKATTGDVNWGQVALSGGLGMATGGAGAWAMRASTAGGGALARAAGVNAGVNIAAGETRYLLTPGDKSWRGALAVGLGSGVSGAIGGAAGPMGGTLASRAGYSVSGPAATAATAGVNFGGGFTGSWTTDVVNGRGVDLGNALQSGALNSGGGLVGAKANSYYNSRAGIDPMPTGNLHSHSHFGPRSAGETFTYDPDVNPTSYSMWNEAIASSGTGVVLESGVEAMEGN